MSHPDFIQLISACRQILKATAEKWTLHKDKWPLFGPPFIMFMFDWQVQRAVHGVTLEECRAALQTHSWSVPQAVNHLKVSAPLHALTLKRSASLSARHHVHKVKTVALIFQMQLTFSAFILQESKIPEEIGGFKHVKVIPLPFSGGTAVQFGSEVTKRV